MATKYLVIVGLWGLGIERSWKRLFEIRWSFWKTKVVKYVEALITANYWTVDLKSIVPWFSSDLMPVSVLESQHGEFLVECTVLRHRVLKRFTPRSRAVLSSSRRSLL